MGVDAQMLVRVPRAVSEGEAKRWSYALGSMAHESLFLGHREKVYHKPLEAVDSYVQDGPTLLPAQGESFFTVSLAGRYYGVGYERGDLLAHVAIAEFLEVLIPGCEIWYGGDSSGIHAEPFTRTARLAFLAHAAEHGHDPYDAAFASLDDGAFGHVVCPACEVTMHRNGFGPRYALFTCNGCGWQIQDRDGVRRQGFTIPEPELTK